jgi:hypothetical protein
VNKGVIPVKFSVTEVQPTDLNPHPRSQAQSPLSSSSFRYLKQPLNSSRSYFDLRYVPNRITQSIPAPKLSPLFALIDTLSRQPPHLCICTHQSYNQKNQNTSNSYIRRNMSAASPQFWAGPLRYCRWAMREKPAIFWSIVIGAAGPISVPIIPPIRHYFGDVDAPQIPVTYPST